MNKRVAFYTLGCKVNTYETNAMMQIFRENGYDIVDFNDIADIYIVNTCTVTNMSDRKSRQILRRAKHKNPKSILCAVGCYAQVAKEDIEKIEEVDIVLGNREKSEILSEIQNYCSKAETRKKIVEAGNIMKLQPYDSYGVVAYPEHTRAEIKIQDGCDRFCTYCIIPYARGPVRSRPPKEILSEIKNIIEAGVQEIVITGIHISSYGKDFSKDLLKKWGIEKETFGLIDLLEEIDLVEGIKRVRLGSLEPRIITAEFISRLKKLKSVCNHFHLSLQSGCNDTLKRMNRKYTVEEFECIVNMLRENIPDVALTTDIIVGFPGETKEEFEETYAFLSKIKFSKMHIFKYSKRKGTPAATYANQVSEDIKDERSAILISMSSENEKEFASKYIGMPVEVLFENDVEGHTTNYIKVERLNIQVDVQSECEAENIQHNVQGKIASKEDSAKDARHVANSAYNMSNGIQVVIPKKWEDGALKL